MELLDLKVVILHLWTNVMATLDQGKIAMVEAALQKNNNKK